MKSLSIVLKAMAVSIIAVGLLHLFLGVAADVMLGAVLSEPTLRDPVLDSQNRFYGISFTLYGVLFYLCATDLHRYYIVLNWTLAVFFLAGMARFVSIATHGLPSLFVLVLLGLELVLPPLLWQWSARARKQSS